MSVYFIQAADGYVKIGRANDVDFRLRALQTAHAKELTLLRSIDGDAVEEWECHYVFRDARIRGEWFEFREEMLTFCPTGRSKVALIREYRARRSSPETCSADITLTSFIRDCIRQLPIKQVEVARRMGMSPASLCRKLSQNPFDSARFTVDDLEKYIQVTGDTQPIMYLIEKYLTQCDDSIEQLQFQLKKRK